MSAILQSRRDRRSSTCGLAALLSTTLLAGGAFAAPALAQEAATVDDNVIIVTAQRRAEALEEVPMSVEVMSSTQMAAAGVNSLRDIASLATGVTLNQGGAYPQPTIRGVTTVVNGTYENNVAVYVDGLYQPSAQAINIDLPNVESVQVLKGPQGTLYGRNATGGAILLNTIMPGKEWKGKAELTYARFDDKRASGYVAGPLSDMFGVSLAGYVRRADSYMKLMSRTTPGETDGNAAPIKQDALRAKLAADLSDSFRAVLSYNYTRVSDGRGNMFSPFENVHPVLAPAYDRMPRKLGQAAWDIDTTIETKQHEGSLTLELDTGLGLLKSITGYSDLSATTSYDFDGSYLNGNWSTSLIKQKTFQQSLDYQIDKIEALDLVVGASYFEDKLRIAGGSPFYGFFVSTDPGRVEVPLSSYTELFRAFFRQKKQAWAVYADATFHATDALSINLGGRYSSEDQDVSARQDSAFCNFALCRAPNAKSAKFSKFTPRASVRYELAPRTNIYLSYSKGFRSGAYNSILPANAADWKPARQESIDAFEAGFKTAGSNYRLELSAFLYDYKNLHVSSTITGTAGNAITTLTNAPKAKIKGLEASFEWEPVENLTIRGGATYLHARFGRGFLLDTVGVNPALAVLNVDSDPLKAARNVAQLQNLSGLQMSRAPDFAGNLGVDYNVPNGEGGLRLAANARYTDSYVVTNPAVWCDPSAPNGAICAGVPADRQRKQRFREGSYVLLNASVTWTEPGGHYFVRVWGNNLTDHKYRLHYTGNANWGTYSPMAEPLTYGATLGYKF